MHLGHLINQTSQRLPRALHHYFTLRIFARLLRPDFFYFVELAFQLEGDLVDLALHPFQAAEAHAGIAAQIVERAVDLSVTNKNRLWLQAMDVALLSAAQRTVDENVSFEVG